MAQMILNIRPAIDSRRDAVTLSRRGVASACLPVMEIVTLVPQLPNAREIAGVVFTSRHAVSAFVDAMDTADWWRIPVFAVGQATSAAAREAGFVSIFNGLGGGAGLVPAILQHVPVRQERILWPAAVDKSFDMASALTLHGYDVQTLDIYVAQPRVNFTTNEMRPLREGAVSGVIAMSSRSVQLFCKLLKEQGLDSRRTQITLIVGSQSIADAAGPGWRQIHVARKPRRSRLLAIATLFYHRQREGRTARMVTDDG